ncbi:hypothetical protein L1987_00183 [Smallanthus sonchifolius]|uniref:Uncharacterized protein n=1 Tax=Smallanthus sonchifolius TaxID=185202 RepID=A0ACB9K1I4_9ASTR|nr:hypothetical protein L1987_00183 [Smallanthus sonchifolius]
MINEGLDYAIKRKKWILLLGALGFSTYGAYRVCNLPSVVKNRDRAMKVLSALASITEFFSDSAETLGVISRDLKEFIQSDSDQIPGYQIESPNTHPGPSFSDRALDKLFSPAGYGFASIIVGSFSRNMVMAIYADREVTPGSGNPGQKWVDVISDDRWWV